MKYDNKKIVEEIETNEERLDNLKNLIERLEKDLEDFESNKKDINLLKRYYGSKAWFRDKEAFENKKISNVKAGVLSEDLVWNTLEDLDSLIERMRKITKAYKK